MYSTKDSLVERSPPETLLKRCSQFKKHFVCISIGDSKDFLTQSAPATKLFPPCLLDKLFTCQWYRKTNISLLTSFLLVNHS